MIYKILLKLGLGHTVLNLAKPFIKFKTDLPEFENAKELLLQFNPDPGNTCLAPVKEKRSCRADLDVIIPAYNVEKYLERCVNSVLSQKTDYSFRIIIVDDGATDSTPQIADSYAKLENVLVIHQKNRGLSGARNCGYEQSDAKYVLFLDSDDYLCPGAIDSMLRCAYENDAAITEGAYNIVDTEGKVISSPAHKAGILNAQADFYGYAWGKLFKSSLFDGLRFPERYWYEDSLMAQVIYPLVKGLSTCGLDNIVCCYTVNPAGITGSGKSKPKCIDSLWITLQLHKDREKLGLEKDQAYYEYILNMITLSYRRTENQSEDVKKAMFVMWREFLEKEFSGFETTRRNKATLQQAVRSGNYALYSAACKLI